MESRNSRREVRHRRVQKIIKYLGLSGSGIGISLIISLLIAGNPKAATISGLLTIAVTLGAIAYKFVAGVINRVLDLIEEELESLEAPLANLIVNQLKALVTLRWQVLGFQDKYQQSLLYTYRELTTEGFRVGLPILDLEDVFVPLRVVTAIPGQINSARIQAHDIWDFLAESPNFPAYRHLAIIGPPGSGKTTLLRHLILTYAKKQNQKYKAPKLIPLLLYLRDIRYLILADQPPSLPELIKEHIQRLPAPQPLNPPPKWIEYQLKVGHFLVMLDGLDEVTDGFQRQQVSQWINRQMEVYPKTVFILTSRPHGYLSASVEQVGTVLEVLPFNLQQVEQFIQLWYLQTEIISRAGRDTPAVRSEAQYRANNLIESIRHHRVIADMAKNPLLVTMIATVHYSVGLIPARQVELYETICDLLLGTRQEAKKIETPLTVNQKKSVLQVLALALMQQQAREFTHPQVVELIQAELTQVGYKLNPEQFLKEIQEVSGLLVEKERGYYQFAHFIFQEYLAAVQVKESQQENILIENFSNLWWSETIRLYAAQSNATNLICQALENPNPNIISLNLALDCIEESLKIEPKAVLQSLKRISLTDYPTELITRLQDIQDKFELFSEEKSLSKLREIRKSLYKENIALIAELPKLQRELICNQFRREYDFLNLFFSDDLGKIEVSERERINAFKEIWTAGNNALNQNDMQAFRINADELTRLFCKSLAFKKLDELGTLGQFYGQMIDASNPAFQLNIRPNFPLIFACKTALDEEDACKIIGLLNKLGISADFFTLLVVFTNYQQIRQQIRESPYTNDFIVLNHDQLWDILAAKSPIQQLTNCILEQIDLIAISPYTVSGPVQEKMFFGRAKEEKTLLQNIARNDYALLANRKTGKTSLLNRIYPRLKNISNYQVFYCDLQTVNSYDIFYQELALSYPEFEEEISNFSELSPLSFRHLISKLKQRNGNRQIIFIFDEVDEILAYDIQENEQLFRTFRSLSQRENIRFIFSGTTTIVKRVRHPESPLFNFCSPIKIGILEENPARDLVRMPMGTLGVKFENESAIIQRILKITAQHPNIIQYICDALIKRINEKQKRTIEEQDLDMIVASQEFYEYFESLIWGQSTALEKLIIYAMWSYSEFTESEVLEEFKRRGIPSEGVKASLEILLTYSTLSKNNDKYFFTFREFAKLMEQRSDIPALTEQYKREIGGSES